MVDVCAHGGCGRPGTAASGVASRSHRGKPRRCPPGSAGGAPGRGPPRGHRRSADLHDLSSKWFFFRRKKRGNKKKEIKERRSMSFMRIRGREGARAQTRGGGRGLSSFSPGRAVGGARPRSPPGQQADGFGGHREGGATPPGRRNWPPQPSSARS